MSAWHSLTTSALISLRPCMIKNPQQQEEDIEPKKPALLYDCAGFRVPAPLYLRTIHGDHQTILHNARYAAEKLDP